MNFWFLQQNRTVRRFLVLILIFLSVIAGNYLVKITSPDWSLNHSKPLNSSPLFNASEGWGAGFALAIGHGRGVVVGPGTDNPNVFAQQFPVAPFEQFRVIARASSVDKPEAIGSVQINWSNKNGEFISVSKEIFKVNLAENTFNYTVAPPFLASSGILYVVPGGAKDVVRYTEMTLSRLNPFDDFMSYRFFGIKGKYIFVSSAVISLMLLFYPFCKIVYSKTILSLCFITVASLLRKTATHLTRIFPLLAMIMCGAAFLVLEVPYELHVDSHWHQAHVDAMMHWNNFSLNLSADPLYNFGIQTPMNPRLSPTYRIGALVAPDHRIQVEGAVQMVILFSLLVLICRVAGARLHDASAISLIATYFLCIPKLSGDAITLNNVLGLAWEDGAIATLFTAFCFSLVGRANLKKSTRPLPATGMVIAVLWFFVAYPMQIAFFAIALSGLCLGAFLGSEDKRELLHKSLTVILLIAILVLLGFHRYILDTFMYTSPMYYGTLFQEDSFKHLFFNSTSLLTFKGLGGAKIVLFYVLSTIGVFFALRFGNRFARKIVLMAVAFEISIYAYSYLNYHFKKVIISFFYVEIMGLSVVALLAATACWAILRYVLRWQLAEGAVRYLWLLFSKLVKVIQVGNLGEIGKTQRQLTEVELELAKIKRELAEVKMERDLLKICR